MQTTTRSRLKLAALLLIAIVPISMATFAFRAAIEQGGLFSTVNKGHLIMPPVDVTALDMRDERTGVRQFRAFEERIADIGDPGNYTPEPWTMVFVTTASCDESCRERVFYLRQLHARLGREAQRVRRYYLHASSEPLSEEIRQHLREEFPSMGLSFGQRDIIQRSLGDGGVDIDLDADNYVFLVDPVGNVMMYYDSSHTTQDIMTDIQRLLKHSSLG